MKKLIILAGALLLMVAGAMTSCRSDDDEPFVTTVSVKDIIGIVQFDNQSNRWALCAIASGTIDNVKKYYPIELERDFQKGRPECNILWRCIGNAFRSRNSCRNRVLFH